MQLIIFILILLVLFGGGGYLGRREDYGWGWGGSIWGIVLLLIILRVLGVI